MALVLSNLWTFRPAVLPPVSIALFNYEARFSQRDSISKNRKLTTLNPTIRYETTSSMERVVRTTIPCFRNCDLCSAGSDAALSDFGPRRPDDRVRQFHEPLQIRARRK